MDSKSNKKKYIIGGSICLILLIVIGATYAYWTTTQVQKDINEINTDCLRISYTNKDASKTGFTLEKAFPIKDVDGRSLEGYTFTIANECTTYINYNVNMESLKLNSDGTVSSTDENHEDIQINIEYIDTILNDEAIINLKGYKQTQSLLTKKDGNTATAYDTRILESGALGPKGTENDKIEYTLRMWLDEDTPTSEMNKIYKGKISVWATPTKAENAVEKITNIANQQVAASTNSTTQLAVDDTADQNIRYIGKDPDNYIDIGNGVYQTDIWIGYNNEDIYKGQYTVEYTSEEECKGNGKYNKHCTQLHKKGDPILWRIIGVMKDNTINDNQTARLKIIRDEDIGMMSWDAKCNTEDKTSSCSGGYTYKNNWNEASLKTTLNEAFWERKTTTDRNYIYVYDGENFNSHWYKLRFEDTGIREISRKLVDNTKWHLGGITFDEYDTATVGIYYSKEHADKVYDKNPTTWNGKVGLMYASDYGYATGGGEGKQRSECLTQDLYHWNASGFEDCYKNDWLYYPSNYQWLMNPYASNDNYAARADYNGFVSSYYYVYPNNYRIRPVLYLKSDVKIVSGTGTKENPYRITL